MSAISPPVCKICHRPHWFRDGCSGRPHIPEARELRKTYGRTLEQKGVRAMERPNWPGPKRKAKKSRKARP